MIRITDCSRMPQYVLKDLKAKTQNQIVKKKLGLEMKAHKYVGSPFVFGPLINDRRHAFENFCIKALTTCTYEPCHVKTGFLYM